MFAARQGILESWFLYHCRVPASLLGGGDFYALRQTGWGEAGQPGPLAPIPARPPGGPGGFAQSRKVWYTVTKTRE